MAGWGQSLDRGRNRSDPCAKRNLGPDANRFRAYNLDRAGAAKSLGLAPLETPAGPLRFREPSSLFPCLMAAWGGSVLLNRRLSSRNSPAKFPQIQTYLGKGIDDPLATGRFNLTPQIS